MHPSDVERNLGRCRAAYFVHRNNRTEEAEETTLETYTRAFADIPACFVQQAFDEWLRRGTRWPSPGDIGNRARQLHGDARERIAVETPATPPPAREEITDAERRRRAELWEERTRGTFLATPTLRRQATPPTWPKPMTDEAITGLFAHRVKAPRLDLFRQREGVSRPEDARAAKRFVSAIAERRRADDYARAQGPAPAPALAEGEDGA